MKTEKPGIAAGAQERLAIPKPGSLRSSAETGRSLASDPVVADLKPELDVNAAESLALDLSRALPDKQRQSLDAIGNISASRLEDLLKD